MRVTIIGGGPAGLTLALLLKHLQPSFDVTVLDRNPPDETYGWGITLPSWTIAALAEFDEPVAASIQEAAASWTSIGVVHRGRRVHVEASLVLGIERIALLTALQRRCGEAGVELRFRSQLGDADPLPDADLVVGADGANSLIRSRLAARFRPSIESRRNRYVWLGTSQVFPELTLGFAETDHGAYAMHAYPFSDTCSTFIVECSEGTWRADGFDVADDAAACARLASIFSEPLEGHALLFRRSVRWAQFMIVGNERWWHDRVVLIGDALHAVHFSVGSGTMLAIEDAIALAVTLAEHAVVSDALAAFESARRPLVERYAALGRERVAWYEQMHEYMNLEPLELAYALLSRSPEIWKRERVPPADAC